MNNQAENDIDNGVTISAVLKTSRKKSEQSMAGTTALVLPSDPSSDDGILPLPLFIRKTAEKRIQARIYFSGNKGDGSILNVDPVMCWHGFTLIACGVQVSQA